LKRFHQYFDKMLTNISEMSQRFYREKSMRASQAARRAAASRMTEQGSPPAMARRNRGLRGPTVTLKALPTQPKALPLSNIRQ
jgi:hypothetical protein